MEFGWVVAATVVALAALVAIVMVWRPTIRMKTITRTLIFLATILVWLVILVLLNTAYLRIDELVVMGAAFLLSMATTLGVVKALRT